MTSKTVMLLALFVILTWVGSAGIALATVELSGGGEQGPPGPEGEQRVRGPGGPAGASTGLFYAGYRLLPLIGRGKEVSS